MNPLSLAVPSVLTAVGAIAYGAVYPRAQLFGSTICRTNSARKLALTFDDGPNPSITPKLLDLLNRYNAKATFFLIGQYVRECPELVQEIAARGHVVGNHTETHPNLFRRSLREIRIELRLCHDAISNALGAPPKWFRPPFGLRNPWLIPRMQPVTDHAQRNLAVNSSSSARGQGDVLCLHDGAHRQLNGDRSRTLAALEYWLPRWRDLGLEFVTIEQAVSTPAPKSWTNARFTRKRKKPGR